MVNETLSQPEAQATHPEPRKPPLPRVIYRVVNPLLAVVLRSPLHGRFSQSMMLLSFHGRKSGKRYTLPVAYVEKNNQIFVLTHRPWWKNVRGGAAVLMRLRGRNVGGTAKVVEDRGSIAALTQAFVDTHGAKMAQRIGLMDEHGNVLESPPGVTFIEINKE